MLSMTSKPFLVGSVHHGKLEFEVVRLQCRRGVGVVRRLKVVGVGLFEMNVLFDSRAAFLDWIEIDEYRHHAPGLMVFVKNRFDELYYGAGGNHEKKPCDDG
jgi:hypothetical protein